MLLYYLYCCQGHIFLLVFLILFHHKAPALLTNISILPHFCDFVLYTQTFYMYFVYIHLKCKCFSSLSSISFLTEYAVPGRFLFELSAVLPTTTILYPNSDKVNAISLPIPLVEPVTDSSHL